MHFDTVGSTPVFKDSFAGLTCDGRAVGSIRRITLGEPAGMVVEEVYVGGTSSSARPGSVCTACAYTISLCKVADDTSRTTSFYLLFILE